MSDKTDKLHKSQDTINLVKYDPDSPHKYYAPLELKDQTVLYVTAQGGGYEYKENQIIFDLDHTLIKPKDGRTFAKDADDWVWLHPNVPKKMKECYDKGYSIVMITNKSKLFTGDQLLNVMNELRKKYKIKYAIAYFTFNKEWRKPNTKMFEAHLQIGSSKHMSLPKLDKKQSFMVGDALGRPHDWSDVDKQFAKNCGMTIVSPETFFEMKPPKPATDIKLPDISLKTTQEVILMMGYPGSGKSTLTTLFEEDENYEVIHGDDYKSNKSKMKKKMKEIISSGKSPVIDATNPSKKARAIFIDIAKDNDLDVRVIRMTTTIEESMERNALREKKVPKIALYMYRKNYEEPTKDEGISNVIEV